MHIKEGILRMKKRSMSEAEILIGLDMFLSKTETPVIDFLLDLKELEYEFISMDDNGMIKAFRSYPYKSSSTGKWVDMQGGESLHIARVGKVFDSKDIYNRFRDSQAFTISDLILDQAIMDEVKSGNKKCKNCDSVKNLINSWEHTSEPDIIEMDDHYDELYTSGYSILDSFDDYFDNEDFTEEDIFESLYREISESDYEEENYSEAEEFLESLEDNIRYILTQYTGIDDDDIIIEKRFMNDTMDILSDSYSFEITNEIDDEEEIILEKVFDVYRDDNMRLLSDGTLFIDGEKVHGAEVGNSDDDYEEEDFDFYNKAVSISTMLPAGSKGTERIDYIFRKLPQIVQDHEYLFDDYDLIYMAVNKDGSLCISEKSFVYDEFLGTYLADEKARFYFKESIGIPPHNFKGKCVFFESTVYI